MMVKLARDCACLKLPVFGVCHLASQARHVYYLHFEGACLCSVSVEDDIVAKYEF